MQGRPSAAVAPLSVSISQLPLSSRRSSQLSDVSTPHTPPNCLSPLPLFTPNSNNRKSTDSWNSSSYDGDDTEWEWTLEQTRFLSRTLDALPAHLLTPFNGPVPPSNLLDKIARNVSQTKGPLEWPHSVRATRAKIVDLARIRAKEVAANGTDSDTIAEEEYSDRGDVLRQTTNTGPRRPLYRQSSMDFMQTAKQDLKDNESISRLSRRLQRTERMILNTSQQPYAPPSDRSTSPRLDLLDRAPFIASMITSTPSSSTLNSSVSGSRLPRLRRSQSSMSNSSDSYVAPAVDPRVQRIKRTESFGGALLYGPSSLKRAPSFGATSRRSSGAMSIDLNGKESDVTSSDEEEKLRSIKAKRARVKAISPTPPASPAIATEKPQTPRKTHAQPPRTPVKAVAETPRRTLRPRANLQRNPSILGPELPQPQHTIAMPATPRYATRSEGRRPRKTPKPLETPNSPLKNSLPSQNSPIVVQTPQSKGLRRVKGSRLPQRQLARKISFGSLVPQDEENTEPGVGAGFGLGSAFQMQ
ncbi:hypothetical protein CERSUDRAFT_117538 [Gelatoporia subvermispora B]|uniref:Uncharacterized protein n=1 Tax=Ceriporiopsis subvermispora (strain B) TaxID=914234 RepID=M2QPD9_CERS8|nr:hypothetical protein CERSUDRAFT_117538 [Gelatoporia subvermispora B]